MVFSAVFGGFLVTVAGFYGRAVEQQEAALRRHVQDQALLLAGVVDVAQHERLTDPAQQGTQVFRSAIDPLVRFHRKHPHVQYVWTVRVSPEDQQTFVLETSVDPEIRRVQKALGRSQDLLPFLGPNDSETPFGASSIVTLRAGQSVVFPVPYVDVHGVYIEARAPLMDAGGRFVGYLGLDYGLDSFRQQINDVRIAGLVALGLALVLAALLARSAYWMREATVRQRAEIERERDRADRASEAKSELLRIASHDLKNPLSAIAGMAGLMLKMKRSRPGATPDPDMNTLEVIEASAKHMSEIVRGILTNEGLESGRLEIRAERADLAKVARDIVSFNTVSANRKKITLTSALPPTLLSTADTKLLREAFDNYVSNALKYSPEGSAITVQLRAIEEGRAVEFAVQDAGPGLSEADQAQLYQKFKKLTPRPTGGESSTGLGLSIVKTIVELHGGSVGCDTSPGRGARFWLRLPVAGVARESSGSTRKTEPAASP